MEPDAAMVLADEFLETVEQTLPYVVKNSLAGPPQRVRKSRAKISCFPRISRPHRLGRCQNNEAQANYSPWWHEGQRV